MEYYLIEGVIQESYPDKTTRLKNDARLVKADNEKQALTKYKKWWREASRANEDVSFKAISWHIKETIQ